MQDRVSLYPGRVKLIPVTGQENTYDMVRADEPTQEGTPLNADSLLKAATATMYGLGAAAVPDDVLALIKTLIDNGDASANANANSRAKMELVSYIGTGLYGSDSACSVTFSFPPKVVFLLVRSNGSFIDRDFRGNPGNLTYCTTIVASLESTEYTTSHGFYYEPSQNSRSSGKKSADGKTFSWYNTIDATHQMNERKDTYYVLGLG